MARLLDIVDEMDAARRQRCRVGRRARLERLQDWLAAYLLDHPCVDCGEPDLRVLEFDHRGGKVADVSRMVRQLRPLAAVTAEVAKCDVRCANCHRRRHAEEADAWRVRYAPVAMAVAEVVQEGLAPEPGAPTVCGEVSP